MGAAIRVVPPLRLDAQLNDVRPVAFPPSPTLTHPHQVFGTSSATSKPPRSSTQGYAAGLISARSAATWSHRRPCAVRVMTRVPCLPPAETSWIAALGAPGLAAAACREIYRWPRMVFPCPHQMNMQVLVRRRPGAVAQQEEEGHSVAASSGGDSKRKAAADEQAPAYALSRS